MKDFVKMLLLGSIIPTILAVLITGFWISTGNVSAFLFVQFVIITPTIYGIIIYVQLTYDSNQNSFKQPYREIEK